MKHHLPFLFSFFLSGIVLGQSIQLNPGKDNTLYQTTNNNVSNGAGDFLFVGQNNQGDLRRGLLYFDVAGSIPAGSTIDQVTLTMRVSKIPSGFVTNSVSVHEVTEEWGEGSSDAGANGGDGAAATTNDATWSHRLWNTQTWTNPGGTFVANDVASESITGLGLFTWVSTGSFVGLVQNWLDNPTQNQGMLLKGGEGVNKTAARFNTRENATDPPVLTINYSAPTALSGRLDSKSIAISPNPSNGLFRISAGLDLQRLELYNLNGNLVKRLDPESTHFDLKSFPSGIYLLKFVGKENSVSKKLILK